MYLSVIIPMFNESKRIKTTLATVISFLNSKKYTHEIILINDGSTDDTLDVVKSVSGFSDKVIIINLERNQGKGNAIKQGMLFAKGEYILFMDADGSTPITELDLLLQYSEQGVDVVVGSRRISGAEILEERTFLRGILSLVFSTLVEITFPLNIKDPQNGFKVFSNRAAKLIFELQTIKRWAFDVEVLVIAKKLGLTVKEIPIHWKNSILSKMNFLGMCGMISDLLRIRANLLVGFYDMHEK